MSAKKPRLLFVDPDAAARGVYRAACRELGFTEMVFEDSADEALARLQDESFDAVVAAVRPGQVDGLTLLKKLHGSQSPLRVILAGEQATADGVTAGLRLGAADFLSIPFTAGELSESLRRVLAWDRLGQEHELLKRQVERPYGFDDIIGACPAMQHVFETIQQVAESDVDVLVAGDTGAGKELVARSIHHRSRRAQRPFVPVDCGAIPENLLEGEFFGHERGAFTGADSRRIGLLEFADEGTFFLDELGELPLPLQAKLLRTLQERTIRRLGGREQIAVDIRIVAATGRDLEAMVREGRFRQDLFYRVHVVRIDLPPLRDRGDDLGLLAEHFCGRYGREMKRAIAGITPEAYQVLKQYRWPGNVRELQNVIRRAIALSKGTMIGLSDLPDGLVAAAGGAGAPADDTAGYFKLRDEHLARFERQYLLELLARRKGDVKLSAEEARLPRGTLYRLLKSHGLDPGEFR